MKKFIHLALFTASILTACFVFSSCNNAHVHSYSKEWSSNETSHWYACNGDNCSAEIEKAEHDFKDADGKTAKICKICGYESTVSSSITGSESAWNDAFNNFELVNYDMRVRLGAGKDDIYAENHCIITDSTVYYNLDGDVTFYTKRLEDGSFVTYKKNSRRGETQFTKLNDTSDGYFTSAKSESFIPVSDFASYYSLFTYDASQGAYICDSEIAINVTVSEKEYEMICYDIVIKITEGKITDISASYYAKNADGEVDGSFNYYEFMYCNIGSCTLDIPQEVIDSAIAVDPYQNGASNA